MKKNLIHICNNYVSSKVHRELILALSENENLKQFVFVPIRDKKHDGQNIVNKSDIYFKYSFYFTDKLKYFQITKAILNFIFFFFTYKSVKVDHIICHNFWTDGLVAFIFNFFKKTPYSLIVRSTDLKYFIPKLKYYHFIMKLMIKKAENVIFINPSYQQEMESNFYELYVLIKNKKIIYNGVPQYWLDNLNVNNKYRYNKVIFVGQYIRRKNLPEVVLAVNSLKKEFPDISLTIVGGTQEKFEKLTGFAKVDGVNCIGFVDSLDNLRNLYAENAILVLPAFNETFGLVYIEALSQGCSVVCSKYEGIYGIYDEKFIQYSDGNNIQSISEKIKYLLINYPNGHNDKLFLDKLKLNHNWYKLAAMFYSICFKDGEKN